MATYSDNEEIPIPLVRRHAPFAGTPVEIEAEEDERSQQESLSAIPADRMTPAVAGGLAGLLGGLAALGVVHGLEPEALGRPIAAAAAARGVDLAATLGIAYVTAAAIGSLVGATFAVVTRYLRKWGPLLLWAVVFFVSLAMLLLAASSAYGRGAGVALSGPILAASAAFAFVVSFSLPIRRRR
jgi:hypothetical protein